MLKYFFNDFSNMKIGYIHNNYDLPDFEKGQIVDACMAGASITKTAELLGFSRATISRTMSEFEKHGKTSNNQSSSGRPEW